MLKRLTFRTIAAFVALAACAGNRATTSSPPQPTAIASTRWFAFHSNQWVNLHHFLYVTARARAGLDANRSAVTRALADTNGFGRLPLDQQAAWNSALDYYARNVAKRDILFDSSLVAVNDQLALLGNAPRVGGSAALDTGIAAALDRAAPAYRALWWPRHDAANRRWIAAIVPLVDAHGERLADEETRIFRRPWESPVRVDVSAYTNWAGAYTTEHPSHVNISSGEETEVGTPSEFETLFHEVLHTMDDSVFIALQTAFRGQNKRYFRDPTHPFIFYTAGELTRREFTGYVPFAESGGLWARNPDYAKILPLLRQYWQPYLDGKSSLQDAMRHIAETW